MTTRGAGAWLLMAAMGLFGGAGCTELVLHVRDPSAVRTPDTNLPGRELGKEGVLTRLPQSEYAFNCFWEQARLASADHEGFATPEEFGRYLAEARRSHPTDPLQLSCTYTTLTTVNVVHSYKATYYTMVEGSQTNLLTTPAGNVDRFVERTSIGRMPGVFIMAVGLGALVAGGVLALGSNEEKQAPGRTMAIAGGGAMALGTVLVLTDWRTETRLDR